MNISWITLRDLEYIVAVAQHLHFGQAARSCHVSQPALSSQIKKMEELLGFPLFERTNRKVSITDRGKHVLQHARTILEEAQMLVSSPPRVAGRPLRGPLRLGVIATLGPYYVPKFLPHIKKSFPEIELLLKEGLTDGLLADLKSGSLDVVLAAKTFDEAGFQVFPLFDEPFFLAVPKDHPLAAKKPLTRADLRGEEMVLLEDGHCLRDQALEICPRNRRGRIRQFHATSLETLRHLVASGMGYTLIPSLAIGANDPMKTMLRYRKLDRDPIGRTIVLVCREQHPRLPEFEMLAHFLRSRRPL